MRGALMVKGKGRFISAIPSVNAKMDLFRPRDFIADSS
jgi:hypothetical protein